MCHPGITEVAKSNDTIECTENTSGVARPANTKETSSNLCQSLARPLHPNERIEYTFLRNGHIFSLTRSRIIAKSGISPTYQNTSDTEK